MNDKKRFSYGATFHMQFFDLPDGYSFSDIKKIHSGMVHSEAEGTLPWTREIHRQIRYFRERVFFTCYMDGIEA
jgi:hypothetical protein